MARCRTWGSRSPLIASSLCSAAAKASGLTRVRPGNLHLLGETYDRRSAVTV